jgi:Protein of unknown function (DUF2785)
MLRTILPVAVVAFGLSSVASPEYMQQPPDPVHDKPFWRAIAANHYQLPPGEKPFALAQELSGYLGSPDPELRDDLAYSILTVWIVNRQQFSPEELLQLEGQWSANLRVGLGEKGTDSVFKRSFSALCLASIAERELKTPFLGRLKFGELLGQALAYLRDERDVRGFDASKGWIHSAAHTADLLAALAENPLFTKQDQSSVLAAISRRLETAGEVFTYGEQDRLANLVARIVTRDDFALDAFHQWLAEMDAADRSVWKDSPPKIAALIRFQNDSYLLRALIPRLLERSNKPASLEAQKAVLSSLERR